MEASAFEDDPEISDSTRAFVQKTYLNLLAAINSKEGDVPYIRNQSFRLVDSVGLVVPTLLKSNSIPSVNLARTQVLNFSKYGMDKTTGLVFHGYMPSHAKGGVPIGAVGWGRGQGWFAIGLIDLCEYEIQHGNTNADSIKVAKKFCTDILACQKPSGGWPLLLNADSREESSCTAKIGYFLAKGQRLGLFGKEVNQPITKAIQFLKSVTRENGSVDCAQVAAAGLNDCSPELNYSAIAQGFTLAFLANVDANTLKAPTSFH